MQHWYIDIKWNERLYAKMYKASVENRSSGTDPTESWHEAELGIDPTVRRKVMSGNAAPLVYHPRSICNTLRISATSILS